MFFERPDAGTQTLLIHIEAQDATVEELRELAVSAGLNAVAEVTAKKRNPDPKTYIGSGKLDEIKIIADELGAELVLFDQELSPTQERNLEEAFERRVLGRTGLILNIFAQRARTHEGKLQVELAQLQHASTRLVRGWTHLDRQRGGSGRGQGSSMGVTGTGETQLETDQRLVHTRIKNINQRLVKVRKQRKQNRRSRQKADIKTVSLVGYTNAGKSTLFNALCATDVHAADQLFATLDPTIRQLELPYLGKSILTDTVGFIRQLPHGLIDAFRATLEEVKQADLLLHVVDASSPEKILHHEEVNAVLTEIDADKVPQLLVYNKVDLTEETPRVDVDEQGKPYRVWVSGLNGDGLELLLSAISARLALEIVETTLKLPLGQGKLRAQLFELSAVVSESVDDDGRQCLQVRLEANSLRKLISQAGLEFADLGIADSRDDQEPWMKNVVNS
ncbi:MAG: GTPase HflX [Pseudomonadales bacterium]|nr:GTPase HflX [Pseudomonadales bacterium]MDG1442441.1 GTPase HflX [Pseudomonadales bacterium]